jgi:predicted transcriptional regulator of viral defense system
LDDISVALDVGRTDASKIAARWVNQGRLTRIRPGLFAPVPMDANPETSGVSDLWQVVPEMFGDSFVTGWSAAEHWDLTDQVFARVCVKTTNPVRRNVISVRDGGFFVTRVPDDQVFGTRTHWSERVRVQVADPHRTIIDMLDDPRVGGGGRHTKDCVVTYLGSEIASPKTLVDYADRIGNGAIFKRLGVLAEHLAGNNDLLIGECRKRLTAGYADFDPSIKGGRVVTRWRVRVPNPILEDLAAR